MIFIAILLLWVSTSFVGHLGGKRLRVGLERDAMPRGAPDYSNVKVDSPVHRLTDLAEHAARLGSVSSYDRSGNVIWFTSFESGLQGSVVASDHIDSTATIVSSRANHGHFSLELDPRNVNDSYANWRRILQFLEAGKIGVEISISVDDDFKNVRLSMWSYDGDYELYAPLDYAEVGGLWKIRDRDLGWVTVLEDFVLQQGPSAWHNIKFTIDTEEKTYGHLLIGRHVIDISSYNLLESEADDLGQLAVRLGFGERQYYCPGSHYVGCGAHNLLLVG